MTVAAPFAITFTLTISSTIGGSGTSQASCSTSSSSITCSIDGNTVTAGSLIGITLNSSLTSSVVYTTAFSCQ